MKIRKILENPKKGPQKLGHDVKGLWSSLMSRFIPLNRPGNIVMFHIGRSGSTVLGDTLDQNPDVFWDGEIYERFFSAYEKKKRTEIKDGFKFNDDPFNLLEKRMRHAGSRFYGFEVKFFHLDFFNLELQTFIDKLISLGFTHFIILERKNVLKKIVSSLIAHESGRYHIASGFKPNQKRINIDTDRVAIDRCEKSLISFLDDYKNKFDQVKQILDGHRVLELNYEDDIAQDPCSAYNNVSDFCCLKNKKPKIKYGKINPHTVGESIINCIKVEQVLQGTAYEWMLHE